MSNNTNKDSDDDDEVAKYNIENQNEENQNEEFRSDQRVINSYDFWQMYHDLYNQSGKSPFIDFILTNKKFIARHFHEFEYEQLTRIMELFLTYNLLNEFRQMGLTLKKKLDRNDLYNVVYMLYYFTEDISIHIFLNDLLDIPSTNILLTKIHELENHINHQVKHMTILQNILEKAEHDNTVAIINLVLRIEFLESNFNKLTKPNV
jgi:hypothetical protein